MLQYLSSTHLIQNVTQTIAGAGYDETVGACAGVR
jgi:hypothetical protein